MHHLYIGLGIAGLGGTGIVLSLGPHNLQVITWSIVVSIAGLGYALDDALQHWLGWNTLFHRLDTWLKKFWLYQRACDWLNKTFFKREKKDA